jgi:hypothetical protein
VLTWKLGLAYIPDIDARTSARARENEQCNILFHRSNLGTRWTKDIAAGDFATNSTAHLKIAFASSPARADANS